MIDVAKTKIDMSIISLPVEPPLITHTVPGRDFSQRSLAPTKGSSPTKEVEKENILPKVNGDDPTPSEGGKEVNTEMNTV